MKQYFLGATPPAGIALFGLLLVLAGCGGSASGRGDAGQITVQRGSLTKAEFIRKANSICDTTRKRQQTAYGNLAKHGDLNTTAPAFARRFVSSVMVPAYRRQIAQISALGAPAGDEETIGAILNALRRGLEKGRREPLVLLETGTTLEKAGRLAVSYGLASCSNKA